MLGLAEKAEVRKGSQILHGKVADFHNIFSADRDRERFLFEPPALAHRAFRRAHVALYIPLYAFRRSL